MIRVTRLANGFTVASDRMESVETVSLGVWADVGTRNEPAEINGVSHLLEHMAFKGTERRSARAIAEEIEAVGGHLNAYTAREQTAYYAKILSADLPLAVDIIGDILQHSTFDAEELARERAVVLQEIGQAEDTPDDIVFDHFQSAAFPDQPMGRPVLGKAEIVGSLSGETIRGYMHRHYAPGRLVLAAAGQVDHEKLVELAPHGLRRPGRGRSRGAGARPLYRRGDPRRARSGAGAYRAGPAGRQPSRPRLLCPRPALDPDGRRHELAAVPGDPREARPRLQHLQLRLLLPGRRAVRRLCRHRREGGGGDPAAADRGAEPAAGDGDGGGGGPGPGAVQGRDPDGAGIDRATGRSSWRARSSPMAGPCRRRRSSPASRRWMSPISPASPGGSRQGRRRLAALGPLGRLARLDQVAARLAA